MKTVTAMLCCMVWASYSHAQAPPPFKQLRYEEDYEYLQHDSSRHWYKGIKYAPLSRGGHTWLTIGGDIRYQYQWFKNENWGETPKDKDGFILTRHLAHADLHVGRRFRTFVQLQSSLANGKVTQPSPVDENQLDLHQAFAEVVLTPAAAPATLTMRVGRQELLYGSQRLVAVRDGPNNRQAFDAARLLYAHRDWKADVFYSRFVQSKPGIFDDGIANHTRFWGAYVVKKGIPLLRNADVYYFGLQKLNARFDDGAG